MAPHWHLPCPFNMLGIWVSGSIPFNNSKTHTNLLKMNYAFSPANYAFSPANYALSCRCKNCLRIGCPMWKIQNLILLKRPSKSKLPLAQLLRVGYGDEKDAATKLLCQMGFPEMTLRLICSACCTQLKSVSPSSLSFDGNLVLRVIQEKVVSKWIQIPVCRTMTHVIEGQENTI